MASLVEGGVLVLPFKACMRRLCVLRDTAQVRLGSALCLGCASGLGLNRILRARTLQYTNLESGVPPLEPSTSIDAIGDFGFGSEAVTGPRGFVDVAFAGCSHRVGARNDFVLTRRVVVPRWQRRS
jgi:hypothetical protein